MFNAFPGGIGADQTVEERSRSFKKQPVGLPTSVLNEMPTGATVVLPPRFSGAAPFVSAGSDVQLHQPLPRSSSAAAQPSHAPPPFDEDDLKLAKRREKRAAARAALEHSSLSAAAASMTIQSDGQPPALSSAEEGRRDSIDDALDWC